MKEEPLSSSSPLPLAQSSPAMLSHTVVVTATTVTKPNAFDSNVTSVNIDKQKDIIANISVRQHEHGGYYDNSDYHYEESESYYVEISIGIPIGGAGLIALITTICCCCGCCRCCHCCSCCRN